MTGVSTCNIMCSLHLSNPWCIFVHFANPLLYLNYRTSCTTSHCKQVIKYSFNDDSTARTTLCYNTSFVIFETIADHCTTTLTSTCIFICINHTLHLQSLKGMTKLLKIVPLLAPDSTFSLKPMHRTIWYLRAKLQICVSSLPLMEILFSTNRAKTSLVGWWSHKAAVGT